MSTQQKIGVCAEIRYGQVHSDLCPPNHTADYPDSYRELLHKALDEWLDKADGQGRFFIGNSAEDGDLERLKNIYG
jgi:hypothetical protein